ncbi:MAG: acyl carrier protein [Lachnospiraceae bacterium]|jgi:acyl carrier protein|nr:acyl carrier protein [Lachnospiraceae bacterium]
MEETIRRVLTELISEEAGKAGRQADLRELGMDSIAFIKIVVALEEESGKEVDDEYLLLDAMNTIEKMERALR